MTPSRKQQTAIMILFLMIFKSRTYYKANKGKIQKRLREHYRNLSEDEKIKKKRNYASKRNKNMSGVDREKRKEYNKNYYCKIYYYLFFFFFELKKKIKKFKNLKKKGLPQ